MDDVEKNQWVDQLFHAIDCKDSKAFVTFLAPSCVFRFGNMAPVEGKENIETSVNGFFKSIKSLAHELTDVWDIPEGKVCHGRVTYTRNNGTVLTVPFANILKVKGRNITEYMIFADISNLYES